MSDFDDRDTLVTRLKDEAAITLSRGDARAFAQAVDKIRSPDQAALPGMKAPYRPRLTARDLPRGLGRGLPKITL